MKKLKHYFAGKQKTLLGGFFLIFSFIFLFSKESKGGVSLPVDQMTCMVETVAGQPAEKFELTELNSKQGPLRKAGIKSRRGRTLEVSGLTVIDFSAGDQFMLFKFRAEFLVQLRDKKVSSIEGVFSKGYEWDKSYKHEFKAVCTLS